MEEKNGSIRLDGRKELALTGVSEIRSFGEELAEFVTSEGTLLITGSGMNMEKLDLETGVVLLTGRICSLYYPEDAEKGRTSLWQRLFSS